MLKRFGVLAFIAFILSVGFCQWGACASPETVPNRTVKTAVHVTAVTAAQTSTVNVAPQFTAVSTAAKNAVTPLMTVTESSIGGNSSQVENSPTGGKLDLEAKLRRLWHSTGIYHLQFQFGNIAMIFVGLVLIWLAIAKGFEPLLLLPIGFGGLTILMCRQDISFALLA